MKRSGIHWFVLLVLVTLGIGVAWLFNGNPLALTIIMIVFGLAGSIFILMERSIPSSNRRSIAPIPVDPGGADIEVEIVMRKLIEDLPIGIMFITNEEKIRFNNRIWNELLGVARELSLSDFKGHPGLWGALNRSIGTEDDLDYLWQVGTQHYQVIIKAVHTGNRFIGILVSGSDVSSFKRLERVQQDFLADFTHELKTPLAALMGASAILTEKKAMLKENELAEFHDIVGKEAARLNHLVDDLIDLTRIGAGAPTLMKSLIPLSEFIFDTSKLFTRELTRKKLTLKTDIPSDLLVFVDPNRFKQVFNNLFSNAIQYTEHGGISITASKEDKMITIHFKDTGIGISAENLPLIFNRFFRADEARSRYAGGAGLGLAIAREIVNAHMGTIEADSQLGIGTEFVIRIPKI